MINFYRTVIVLQIIFYIIRVWSTFQIFTNTFHIFIQILRTMLLYSPLNMFLHRDNFTSNILCPPKLLQNNIIYRVYLKDLHKLWGVTSTQQNYARSSYEHGSEKASFSSYSSAIRLREVLKMSSVRFNTCLDTSYLWLSNSFWNVGNAEDSVTATHNVLLKNYVVNRCVYLGF
jgi:hypothetical protein